MTADRALWLPPGTAEPPPRRKPDAEERADYGPHGYEWCRAHQEWHRPPECVINEHGEPDPWWERPYE